jgi:hypothetical protein
MGLKVFSDAIDALEKLADAVIKVKNIPKNRRKRYRQAVSQSFELLNAAMNLILLRLGDLLLIEKKTDFIRELKKLDNNKAWLELERDVRLCSNLRATHMDMDGVLSRMIHFGQRDWDKARLLVDQLLERERSLADYISNKLQSLAHRASNAQKSNEQYKKTRTAVGRFRNSVRKERLRLIRSETAFLDALGGRTAG